jgi:hypothetical protein
MATLAIPKNSTKLFNNISDDEDDAPFCIMARDYGTRIIHLLLSSFHYI